MPSAAARQLYEDQIPSFMSVFDLESGVMDGQGTVTVVDPNMMEIEPTTKFSGEAQTQLQPAALPSDPSHQPSESLSARMFESADSSPTTTMSCTDSSSLSDPSPSSSPDSPVNLVPLSSYPASNFGGLPSIGGLTVSDSNLARPMTSPSPRRARNMKGLSIQPPFVSNSLSSSLVSEPSSPSFIKPKIPAMKRKPSQLSLKTSTSDLAKATTLEIPQSPSIPPILQRRALKHSTSSPHMLSSLKSATFGPAGGMTIPTVLERNESGLSSFLRPPKQSNSGGFDSAILEEESPIRTQIASRAAFEFEPYHEHENNEDQKTPGYPDGPIAIYGDNVFLYLEPTAEEASRFDVVINVAREVTNPFKACQQASTEPATDDKPMDDSPIPDTAVTAASYATAFEFPQGDATPTTPKAVSFALAEPEYIHIPWDHNTDISTDLMNLCETIEKKTREGKKVLIHCQQGASRSASLIIAYGLYQNPELSVNDAYRAAQSKSRWISPNMRLMYCLQDFQKEVSKKKLSPNSGLKPRSGRSPTKHRTTMSASEAISTSPKEPLTAPLPSEDGADGSASPAKSPLRLRGNSTPNSRDPVSPGPSSAPSSFSWTEKEDESDPHKYGRFNLDNTQLKPSHPDSGFVSSSSLGSFAKPPPSPGFGSHRFGAPAGGFGLVPLNFGSMASIDATRDKASGDHHMTGLNSYPDDAALLSPRVETMTNNPLHGHFTESMGMRFIEVPPTPSEGLFSPRETMFPRDPFSPFGRPPQVADPRSPPTKGETPIVRSIDEFI
ncbi:uncharacterized protein E0L32_012155 [Thyridium curvatum]|uniref:protein-tyrosine-phosphatase n=1 Tax=Thyridium curvatum TaxID=1093900 RepID=A0A507BIW6_9PEZI|nr:uncharacterized protein E0L32_012155 [Thyridium curvatum]TPX17369.1 hypothetical protein E0L32_012155 [Thyridium curvatum]